MKADIHEKIEKKRIVNRKYNMKITIPKSYISVKSPFDGMLTRSLSRKEVFQPHLPVRLPCYDLAPVTSFTLGRSFDGYELQVPPASMA